MYKYMNKYNKLMKNNILILILMISLIGIASAETSWGTYRQNDCIDLSIVSDASSCIISSLKYPNSTNIVANINMTNSGGEFNYTTCSTDLLGIYTAKGNCDLTPWDNDFEVTPSGMTQSTSQGIMSIVIMISIIFVTFFFGILSFKLMDYPKIYPIAMFFLVLSIIIAMFGMYLGFTYSRDYLYSASSDPYGKLFIGVLISLTGIAFIVMLGLIIAGVKEISEAGQRKKYGDNYNAKTKQYE